MNEQNGPAVNNQVVVPPPLLRAVELTKRYGHRPAVDGVSFELERGEIVGVVGRRGTGKSTLLHLLAGLQSPSSGELYFQGKLIKLRDLPDAHRLGIELVPQLPTHVEAFDVLTNIFLGHEIGRVRPDLPRMYERAKQLLADLDVSPSLLNQRIDDLSDEQKQFVAIARVLCFDRENPAALILLDDVLPSLSFQRQEKLLDLIRSHALNGTAFLIASDNLKHLFNLTDRLLVLYEGRLVRDQLTSDTTPREIVELTVGATQAEQVTPIIWALESFHQAQLQAQELRRVQVNLRESLEAQGSLNQQLMGRMRAQVEALNQLTNALQAAQRRLMTEREEERKALARELHDQVIQELLSFNYRLEELEDTRAIDAQLGEVTALRTSIRHIVSDLRQLCSDLRPPTLDSHGLSAAIRSHAQEWAENSGVTLKLDLQPDLGRLPEPVELSVFRIVQEALNNIRRHAAARTVTLSLRRTSNATILLSLSDDGQGAPEPIDLAALSAQKHFGLLGISERVALLSGALKIESKAGKGLALQVEIPSPSPLV
jgi:signal transduction histidine kinase